jgi:TolA-binding protein
VRKFLLLIGLIALPGCFVPQAPSKVVTGPETDYQNAELLVKEKKYREAIAAYRKIAADSPPSSKAADSLFEAAYLQAFHDNPAKDYGQALLGFNEFLWRYPDHAKAPDAENWRAVLKLVLDTKKENDRLNKSIEQLKNLDIRHEERRRK